MSLPLEDYALIGDTHSAALVGKQGSIDWLCWPRFDSDACFTALLGDETHGRWLLAPMSETRQVRRHYLDETLVLVTDFETATGTLRITDFMPPRGDEPDLVRVAECTGGTVDAGMELAPRFGYGDRHPWVRRLPDRIALSAGPDALSFFTEVPVDIEDGSVRARFRLERGQRATFLLAWHRSHRAPPAPIEPVSALEDSVAWWRAWAERCNVSGRWREPVLRSLITLKALTFSPTAGLVAAPTTSLPEQLGGIRNWDYRFCWLRDATFTLLSLMNVGYHDEARGWRDWLLRACAGEPAEMQIMYGVAGERRLTEVQLPWLPGYASSSPVRIGNAAERQLQLDVFGEVMDCLHQARVAGLPPDEDAWTLQRALMEELEARWRSPDEGIWEVRGEPQHFTHSRVMAWVAFDRAVRAVEELGLHGPVDRWRRLRSEIHQEVCARGFSAQKQSFTRAYGSDTLDAALLMIPLVGFLPPDDPRVVGTVCAIQRELCHDGFILRYDTARGDDGLPPGEGAFLSCTFWLADVLALMGRRDEALHLFERLLRLRNDVGLLAEEYDPIAGRLVGNFPQAFSHIALVNTAVTLSRGLVQSQRAL